MSRKKQAGIGSEDIMTTVLLTLLDRRRGSRFQSIRRSVVSYIKSVAGVLIILLCAYAFAQFLLGELFDHLDAPVIQRSWSTKEAERIISAGGDTLAVGAEADSMISQLENVREVWVR